MQNTRPAKFTSNLLLISEAFILVECFITSVLSLQNVACNMLLHQVQVHVFVSSMTLQLSLLIVIKSAIARNPYNTKIGFRATNKYQQCEGLFNEEQCSFITNVLKTYLHEVEQKLESERLQFDKEKHSLLDEMRILRQDFRQLEKTINTVTMLKNTNEYKTRQEKLYGYPFINSKVKSIQFY